jgi:hypothetical protein
MDVRNGWDNFRHGAAALSGVQDDDILVAVNDTTVFGMAFETQVTAVVRAKAAGEICLVVYRDVGSTRPATEEWDVQQFNACSFNKRRASVSLGLGIGCNVTQSLDRRSSKKTTRADRPADGLRIHRNGVPYMIGTNYDKIEAKKLALFSSSQKGKRLDPKNKGLKKFLPRSVYEFFWKQASKNVYDARSSP